MPNHFHLILRQTREGGIKEFMQKALNSYTKYYNTKHNRVGPLFQGQFKAVLIESNEQLMHLSRYIHLNPFVAEITKDYENFPYSSYSDFIGNTNQQLIATNSILSLFSSSQDYQSFVKDHASYALELGGIKQLLIDIDYE